MKASIASLAFVCQVLCLTTAVTAAFDCREATIDGIHNALYSGLTSCREVTSCFLSRIEAFDPTIHAIISLNPKALQLADGLDAALASGNATGALFCIPVLLKDNYDTVDMNTTAGCLALKGNKPMVDAPTVVALKKAGAIVLGKTNLHELALEGLSVSSLGGQTINPYDHSRTPGGSSGGTGAALAASFAVIGTGESLQLGIANSVLIQEIGTDTVNSLRSPASANSLFSVRPTRGLISRTGTVPISYTQDNLGPFARNMKDLAVALTVMASVGYDENDNTTSLPPKSAIGKDYSGDVYGGSLKGLRLGLVSGFFNHTAGEETTPVNNAMSNMVSSLQAAGVTIVSINETVYNATAIASLDVQTYEFRETMDLYMQMSSLAGSRPANLSALYKSGDFLVIPAQYNFVNTALQSSTNNASYASSKQGIQNLTAVLRNTLTFNNLDAIIYPEQKNLVVKIGSPSQAGRNGVLAALTGFPVVTIPAGFSPPTADAPIGVPMGMEILGLPWTESKLLNIAAQISDLHHVRRMPAFANGTVGTKTYGAVPQVVKSSLDFPTAYPIGVL